MDQNQFVLMNEGLTVEMGTMGRLITSGLNIDVKDLSLDLTNFLVIQNFCHNERPWTNTTKESISFEESRTDMHGYCPSSAP